MAERAIAFSEAVGRPSAFRRADPEARLGPLPILLYCRKKKRQVPKRAPDPIVLDFMVEHSIPLKFAIPHPDSHAFERRRVLEALDVEKPDLQFADYIKSWGSLACRLVACRPLSFEDCLAAIDGSRSAGEPWSTTKGSVIAEKQKAGQPVTVWLSDQQHRDLVQGIFQRFTKEELRAWTEEFVLKDPHSISGIEFYAQLLQAKYCGALNRQLYDIGSKCISWFTPGLAFCHGMWDTLARYHYCDEDRVYFCWDFKTNNETHDLTSHRALCSFRGMFWADEENRSEARRVWDFDWESLVCLPSGEVVPVHQLNSGSYNTTIANTLQCKAKWDAICRRMEQIAGCAMERRRDSIMGDNGLSSIAGRQAGVFTPEFAIRVARELGMVLTCRSVRHITSAEFCSHVFVPFNGVYCAFPDDVSKVFCSLAFPPVKSSSEQVLSRFVANLIRTAACADVYAQVQECTERWVAQVPASQQDEPFCRMLAFARKTPRFWLAYVHTGKLESVGPGEHHEAHKVLTQVLPHWKVGSSFFYPTDGQISCRPEAATAATRC